jgi:plasmid maintenance system antidote protein VapI
MKRKSIVETLREAIEGSALNITQLGELSGVDKAQISRFVNEKRTLTLESAERIAEALGLELKPKRKKR